jgi:hypothetical protein
MKNLQSVMCCFCGESLAHKDSVEITISMSNSEESQGLFSHANVLRKFFTKKSQLELM